MQSKLKAPETIATSVVFEQGVDINTICQAATWKNTKTFSYYKLDVDRWGDMFFGLSVLRLGALNIQKKYNLLMP